MGMIVSSIAQNRDKLFPDVAAAKSRAMRQLMSKNQKPAQPAAPAASSAPTKARPGKRVRTGLGEPAQTADRTLLGN